MKVIKMVFVFFFFFLFFQWFITLFLSHHESSYLLEKNYRVTEYYQKNLYNIEIMDQKKRTFHFQFRYDLNQQKEIVKKLKIYNNDTIICLYPTLLYDKESYLSCRDQKTEFSYQVLKEKYPSFYEEVSRYFQIKEPKQISKKIKDITYYPDLLEEKTFVVWAYDGIYYLSRENRKKINLFSKDQYENQYGIRVGSHYLVANTDQNHDFQEWYILSLKDGSKEKWKTKISFSFDGYFLGVKDKDAYYFDKDAMIEYKITPSKKKIEIVGNKEKNALYYDGKWKKRNIYDLKNDKIVFASKIKNKKLQKKYPHAKFYNGFYATYMVDGNRLFVFYDSFDSSPVLLSTSKELKEIKIVNDEIYFIDQDTLYSYQQRNGLQKILQRREIKFNSQNIYEVYNRKE